MPLQDLRGSTRWPCLRWSQRLSSMPLEPPFAPICMPSGGATSRLTSPCSFLTSLIFCNRLWWLHITQGSDVSYWSLSYEIWYNVIFGVAIFGGTWRFAWAFLAMAVAGPNILCLFPLWRLGVFCYHLCRRANVGWSGGLAICLISLAFWAFYEFMAWEMRFRHVGPTDIVHRGVLIQDYIIGCLFAAHLVGFHAMSKSFSSVLEHNARWIRWSAGVTFTIYLFHVPVAQFFTAIIPWSPTSSITRFIMFPGMLAIMFGIAEFTERRKEWWRRAFTLLIDRLLSCASVRLVARGSAPLEVGNPPDER